MFITEMIHIIKIYITNVLFSLLPIDISFYTFYFTFRVLSISHDIDPVYSLILVITDSIRYLSISHLND